MTLRPGATNSLVDVAGLRVGHANRVGDGWQTGVTVVLPRPGGAVAGVDVRGAAPGTRETDLLDPRAMPERAHALVFSGGSAYGLAAADGVVQRLGDAGVGFAATVTPGEVVPLVPAAVIYDLGRGGRFRATPDSALGAAAYDAATAQPPAMGSVGAGTGAWTGGLTGGVGTASTVLPSGTTVAVLAVVNAAGSTVDPVTGELYGAPLLVPEDGFELRPPDPEDFAKWKYTGPAETFNTTIGVVATDAVLTKAQCAKLAAVAHDGLARAIRPAHSMLDGDTIFALATGDRAPVGMLALGDLLAAGADTFTRAVVRAMLAADGHSGYPSYREAFPSAVVGR